MKNDTLDREIRKRVQALESEIPPRLEGPLPGRVGSHTPLPVRTGPKLRLLYWMGAAAAACAVAILLWFSPWQRKTGLPPQPEPVMVLSPRLEGESAEAYIFKENDPDMTIIWVERKTTGGTS